MLALNGLFVQAVYGCIGDGFGVSEASKLAWD